MSRDKPQLLITGATGFVGRCLCERTRQDGWNVRATIRNVSIPNGVVVGDIGVDTVWADALKGIDIVIHLAARVHVMNDSADNPLTEFRKVNVDATLNLARQAAAAGVKRFIFISSIKVNGESTLNGAPFTEEVNTAPIDPYGLSKYEAEEGLRLLADKTGMEVTIIRPVLVYGSGVKGNFLSMMRWLARGVPLPLGAINNKRSFLAVDNLVDLILTCIDHPAAANQTFLASDNQDLSTSELLRLLGEKLDSPARLVPVPMEWLKCIASLCGRNELGKRLCDSLQVDISKAQELLGWQPPVSMDVALQKTATSFLQLNNR